MNNNKKLAPYSRKVFIDKSGIHGLGVLAKKNIKKGEIIFIIKGKKKSWKVKNQKDALFGDCWIGIGKDLWIDPTGYGKYINHSSNPNSGIKGSVVVRAMQDIKKCEEITIDYSTTEDQTLWYLKDLTNGKKIRSIQFIPEKKFHQYMPYIPKYFQTVYKKHHRV